VLATGSAAVALGTVRTVTLPVIDLAPAARADGVRPVADAIDAACRDLGFFCVVGHGVPQELIDALDHAARAFFAGPLEEKQRIAMARGGRAWRGWFALGDELTAGVPDQKEGLYFGTELPPDDPRVREGLPLHGVNLYPEVPAELRELVPAYIDAITEVGRRVLRAMAVGLGLDADWFDRDVLADPIVLFRIFRYPPTPAGADAAWGVSEHTDYGLLTLLHQDDAGGLEVKGPDGWRSVPPVPGSFVVNLGDMLERMTGGTYRSTVHRVRNLSERDRLSFPLFLDPGWDVRVPMIPGMRGAPSEVRADARWDGTDPLAWEGSYGDYLLTKVAKVFPDLARVVGADDPTG
jgi:polar amino acid transport system ATP-binding protein